MSIFRWISDLKTQHKFKKQRAKRKFSDDMCYSVYDTLLELLPKMIETMRKYKNGYPELDFKEVDNFPVDWVQQSMKELEKEFNKKEFNKPDLKDPFTRWHLILMRISYCLIQADENQTSIINEYSEEYSNKLWNIEDPYEENKLSTSQWFKKHTEPIKFDENKKPKLYAFKFNKVNEDLTKKWLERDSEILKYRDDMKTEAFNLINNYFWNLWD